MGKKFGWYSTSSYYSDTYLVVANPHDTSIDIELEFFDEAKGLVMAKRHNLPSASVKRIRLQDEKDLRDKRGLVITTCADIYLAQLQFFTLTGFSFINMEELDEAHLLR